MPAVSIIIPAYESHATIAGCLEALRGQTRQDFEVIIVDSSPSRRTQEIVRNFPEVRLIRSERRLLPFAARNLGFRSARGDILVTTDPDVYPGRDWLERLVGCHERTGYAVSGGVTCFGERLFDQGVHFCKYHWALPYKPAGPVGFAGSANFLFTRDMHAAVGPFKDDLFCSDLMFSLAIVARGYTIWFEPDALVSHHHIVTWREYFLERFTRGKDFGQMRAKEWRWSKPRLMLWLLISIFPVRLARLLIRTGRTAQRGGVLRIYLLAQAAVAAGFAAWLAGEAAAYAEALGLHRLRPRRRSKDLGAEDRTPNQGIRS